MLVITLYSMRFFSGMSFEHLSENPPFITSVSYRFMRRRLLKMNVWAVLGAVLATFVPGVGFGQTGPGGVGNSSNNVLWLSADYGLYSDAGVTPATNGANVRQWNDRSGNNKHAVETDASHRPNYQVNQMNGLPVLRFSGSADDRILSSGVTTNNRATVWVVARYFSLPRDNPGLLQGSSTPFTTDAAEKSIGMWISSTSSRVWGRGVESGGLQRNLPQNTSTSANATYAICNIYGTTTINQYVNGVTAGSVSYNGTLRDWSEVGIGRQGSESWDGDIAEVIVFNTALNEAQRIIIDNYLAAKYNFAITNDLYTRDGAGFDHEVAGIGQVSGANHTDAQSGIVRINNPNGLGNSEFYLWGHDNGPLQPTTSNTPAEVVERVQRVWSGNRIGTFTFNLHVDFDGIGDPALENMRLIVDTDGDGFFNDESTATGGLIPATAVNGTVYSFQGITLPQNRNFTFGTVVTPLPVDLLHFDAGEDNGAVVLTWSTASEKDNSHFTIERSPDGENFQFVGMVDGMGTISTRTDYSFTDKSPYKGRSYYRLSQTDYNGTQKYISTVKVDVGEADPKLRMYPNPSNGVFEITFKDAGEPTLISVTVLDLRGHQVYAGELPANKNAASRTFEVDLQGIVSPGIYLVSVAHGSARVVERMVVE